MGACAPYIRIMLSTYERVVRVANALDHAVSVLHSPMDTRLMVSTVAYETKEPQAFVTGLLSVLREGHPSARHDGEPFTYMGRPAKRWRWHPSTLQSSVSDIPAPAEPEPLVWGSPAHEAELRAAVAAGDFDRADEYSAVIGGFASVEAMQAKALQDTLDPPDADET